MNDCACTGPGWCERHKVDKPASWVKLCQTSDKYWTAWESGHGPGQNNPQLNGTAIHRTKRGLGDNVETMLAALGITPERYVDVKQRFGLPPTCNCAGRKEWLNKVGRWLSGSENHESN